MLIFVNLQDIHFNLPMYCVANIILHLKTFLNECLNCVFNTNATVTKHVSKTSRVRSKKVHS